MIIILYVINISGLEDITLVNTGGNTTCNTDTLVAEVQPKKNGGTYLINNYDAANNGDDTINDVTDIHNDDEISIQDQQATLTAGGSDAVDDGEHIPDLPRDPSVQGTPLQSGGESSRETTPLMGRKLSPRKKRQMYPERYLTFTKTSPNKQTTAPAAQNGSGESDSAENPSETTSGYRSQDTLSSRYPH